MGQILRQASFSRCGQYRYTLRRRWPGGEGTCVFIGLNPSVGDGKTDDPTIRRCIGFAIDWGFEELLVVNLFAFRTPYPAALKCCADPAGPHNRRAVRTACQSASLIVAAWGVHGSYNKQNQRMAGIWRDYSLYCFAKTRAGHPTHPLYQKRTAKLQRFQ